MPWLHLIFEAWEDYKTERGREAKARSDRASAEPEPIELHAAATPDADPDDAADDDGGKKKKKKKKKEKAEKKDKKKHKKKKKHK